MLSYSIHIKKIFYGGIFMRVYRVKDYDDMSRKAANVISAQVIMKPDCVLGLATGSSPIGTYKQLIDWHKKGDLDFSQVKSVNLDEYKGLPRDNDQSYYYFMYNNLFKHINIDLGNTNVPNGMEPDAEKECLRYEDVVAGMGGVDLQLLGLGHNGHIGFNEPDDSFSAITHDDVPKQAYTMGIGTIMKAKKILLIVSGEDKADALAKAVHGPVVPQLPASILQFHNDVVVIADEAACSKMPK